MGDEGNLHTQRNRVETLVREITPHGRVEFDPQTPMKEPTTETPVYRAESYLRGVKTRAGGTLWTRWYNPDSSGPFLWKVFAIREENDGNRNCSGDPHEARF
jgi:hypothetical protein